MLNLLGHIFKIIIVFTKSDKSFWGKIYFGSIYNIWKDMKIITSNLTKSRKSPCFDCEYPLTPMGKGEERMFLKRLKLTNYRKFSSEKNIVEFISSKIVLNQDNDDINDNFEENSVQNDCDEIHFCYM